MEAFSDGQDQGRRCARGLAAVGLMVLGINGITPALVPLAAMGIALIQAGAVVVHITPSESQQIVMNLDFIAMAVLIALGRLGGYPL